jgi:hypothetical protein
MTHRITGVLLLIAALAAGAGARAAEPRWTVRGLDAMPLTSDGGHLIEGTATAPTWAWHAKLALSWAHDIGLADLAHQTRADLGFGLGLPLNLEIALGFPMGFTAGSREKPSPDRPTTGLVGMSEDGAAIGDLRAALMWSYVSAGEGGLGLLLGASLFVPTGDHERLMGEGGFAAEPFASVAFSLLSTRISLNLAYRVRPEHVALVDGARFEQDDDLIWRIALRIPKENDIAWSAEAAGAIGFVTDEGPWPSAESRPVWLGGGVDFPMSRQHRLGLFAGFGLVGETLPDFQIGVRFSWLPVLPDEDRDGVGGVSDRCPLLAEDRDGFEDDDGCPDRDNDRDGFPDDEDACPNEPANGASEDGC